MMVDILAERRPCYGVPWKPVESYQVGTGKEPMEFAFSGRTWRISVEEAEYSTIETRQRIPLVTVRLLAGQGASVVMGGFPNVDWGKETSLPTPSGNFAVRTNRPWVELRLGGRWFGGGEHIRIINPEAQPRMIETPEEDLGYWKVRLAPIAEDLGIACL